MEHPDKIVVVFAKRHDGGLRVFSDDVPGFLLSHIDVDAVMADVPIALSVIMSEMYDRPLRVDFHDEAPPALGDADEEKREYGLTAA